MYPIYTDIVSTTLKYWANIMSRGEADSLVYKAMLESYSIQNLNTYNVISGIRDTLGGLGLHELWNNIGGKNTNANVTKKYLKLDFHKYWNTEICNQNHSRYLFF